MIPPSPIQITSLDDQKTKMQRKNKLRDTQNNTHEPYRMFGLKSLSEDRYPSVNMYLCPTTEKEKEYQKEGKKQGIHTPMHNLFLNNLAVLQNIKASPSKVKHPSPHFVNIKQNHVIVYQRQFLEIIVESILGLRCRKQRT